MNALFSVSRRQPALALSAQPPFWVEYIPRAALSDCLTQRGDRILGVIHYTGSLAPRCGLQIPQAVVPLVQIDADYAEVWSSRLPLQYGHQAGIAYAKNSELLFAICGSLEAHDEPLDTLISRIYDQLLSLVRVEGYPYPVRVWNVFHAINADQGGIERYQRFSIGRQVAFVRHGHTAPTALPAASAVGTESRGLWIYALATRRPAVAIENRRQISAYHYPRRYGPSSPLFSRATLKDWGRERHLYLSGTASIVGHKSLHRGKVEAQQQETCRNLRFLLETARARYDLERFDLLRASVWKVYLRDPGLSAALIAERLKEVCGLRLPLLIIKADLCRAELLIEIEGILRFAK